MTFTGPEDRISRTISLLCASHVGKADFFDRFRTLARGFSGVDEVAMVAIGQETSDVARPGSVFTSTPIRILDEAVGELQVYIRVASFRNSSPLPVTRFLARQLEMALRGSALHNWHSALTGELASLKTEVQDHKLLERARGVIESKKLIPAGEGGRLLAKVSRKSGKNVRELASGILTAAEKNPWRFRKEFCA